MKYVIDTHALIWFIEGNSRLGGNAKTVLSDSSSKLILPATAFAEAVWIVERGKTSIPDTNTLLRLIKADSRITVYPLDVNVVELTISLSVINEMHDRQIVATTLFLENKGEIVALLTCDQNITASNLVTIIW